jgi:hypothetical protein
MKKVRHVLAGLKLQRFRIVEHMPMHGETPTIFGKLVAGGSG